MLCAVYVLMAWFSVHAVNSSKGLVCTNDFINNVSCSWNSLNQNPAGNCRVSGVKRIWEKRIEKLIVQSCKLEHSGGSIPSCSFAFKNREFSGSEVMPNISVKCNGTLVESIHNYVPKHHIRMHPPTSPIIHSSARDVNISWSVGQSVSEYLQSGFQFHLQVKESHQSWEGAKSLFSQQQDEVIPREWLKGSCQFRVRVNPINRKNSQWSEWSPTSSWVGASPWTDASTQKETGEYQISMIAVGLPLPLILIGVFVLYRRVKTKGFLKEKPVPNPSEYFHSLQSDHEGGLKKWLNPFLVPELFFTASPDHVSTVEVCKDWDGIPSSSASISTEHHVQSLPSMGSSSSGAVDSDVSSSCFSNMGYFMSSSSEGSTQTSSPAAYFTCEKDFRSVQSFISVPVSTCPDYERLQRVPHSPDSGFCIGNKDQTNSDVESEQDFDDMSSPLIFSLHLQHLMGAPPSPPTFHCPISPAQLSTDDQPVDDASAESVNETEAWPVSGAMCRSSSMPVESSKTGYMTIKELHARFSNTSI